MPITATARKPRKHVMALTYEPKIDSVRAGNCTQAIRPDKDKDIERSDTILFHGWEGRPYRSKWDWRYGPVVVKQVIRIRLYPEGVYYQDTEKMVPWERCEPLANLDGIDTWLNMRDYFMEHNSLKRGPAFVIIRWWSHTAAVPKNINTRRTSVPKDRDGSP